MVSAPPTPQLHELADTLWYERRLLEFLLFKLVSANLVLIANDHRFVAPAIAEVERVMEEVRRAEVERAGAVARLAEGWGVAQSQLTPVRCRTVGNGLTLCDFLAGGDNGFLVDARRLIRAVKLDEVVQINSAVIAAYNNSRGVD